jgi:hypothetical protein
MADEYLGAEVQYKQIANNMRYVGSDMIVEGKRIDGTPIERIEIEKGRGDFYTPGFPVRPIDRIIAPTIPGRPNPGIGGGMGLVLSLSDIEAIIPKLQSVSSELRTLWKNTLMNIISEGNIMQKPLKYGNAAGLVAEYPTTPCLSLEIKFQKSVPLKP